MEDLTVHKLDIYPVSKYYIEQLKMPAVFAEYMPKVKGSTILSECLSMLVQNIVISPKPLYQMEEWIKGYADGQGEFGYEAKKFTDDRFGSALDALYAADRQSIMMQLSCNAIEEYKLKTEEIHNDSTTITLRGAYENQEVEEIQFKRGHNKDGRPDLKQIVFGLNVTADGHVPLWMNLHDGNTSDDQTHQVNWNELRLLLEQTDFCYIADCKVATKENMEYIDKHSGTFISVLPATRRETGLFKQRLRAGEEPVIWTVPYLVPHSRHKNETVSYSFYEDTRTADSFRLIWVHSDAKEKSERQSREAKIIRISKALDEMQPKLNRYKLKTEVQIRKAVDKVIQGATALFTVEIIEHKVLEIRRVGRGRPGPNSKFAEVEKVSYSLTYSVNAKEVEKQKRQDGVFPLVTNTDWDALKVFRTYKEQPYLEKRFNTLKSVLNVVPIFLKKPKRIEAMLLLYFLALMVVSLIERQIRNSMKEENIESLPILPQGMKTKTPTINNLRYLFRDTIVVFIDMTKPGTVHILRKGFDKIHEAVLKLLKIPPEVYQINDVNWWKFKTD